MAYHSIGFFMVFLPVLIAVYHFTPQKYRWLTLLAANYIFFWMWSKWLVLYNVATTVMTYLFARKLSSMKKAAEGEDRKAFKKKKHRILVCSVLLNLGVLVALKYTNFIGQNLFSLFGKEYTALNILVPIGISYYTMQAVSYLNDVANKKVEAGSLGKTALYLSFFATLVEGPISRYGEVADDLYAGHDITWQNLTEGYQRILWGLFRKIAIADYLAIAVDMLFENYWTVGSMSLFAAVLCTWQLYMDFAGTIDIVIGAGKVFGINIPENFRQPFFAKNAGDFWHRWHITLGAFFRDYIFYPVSLSKPVQKLSKWTKNHLGKTAARYIGPAIALLLVWLANGFWHGPYWTYVFYGLYYFVLMVIEMFLEKPFETWCNAHHLPVNGKEVRTFRFVKLFIIVIVGELFFRAPTFSQGWTMLCSIFTNFDFQVFRENWSYLGLGGLDFMVVVFNSMVVILVSILKEKGISLRRMIETKPVYVRWIFWYACILMVVFFGAYGPGFDSMSMMYAGF